MTADMDGEAIVFQSTPPREGRPDLRRLRSCFMRFNPRPRVRGDVHRSSAR